MSLLPLLLSLGLSAPPPADKPMVRATLESLKFSETRVRILFLNPGMREDEVARLLRLGRRFALVSSTVHSALYDYRVDQQATLYLFYRCGLDKNGDVQLRLIDAELSRCNKVIARVPKGLPKVEGIDPAVVKRMLEAIRKRNSEKKK